MAIAQYLSKARLPDPMNALGRRLTVWRRAAYPTTPG
jgi:hypothetical protein